jgi:hypothetical protein
VLPSDEALVEIAEAVTGAPIEMYLEGFYTKLYAVPKGDGEYHSTLMRQQTHENPTVAGLADYYQNATIIQEVIGRLARDDGERHQSIIVFASHPAQFCNTEYVPFEEYCEREGMGAGQKIRDLVALGILGHGHWIVTRKPGGIDFPSADAYRKALERYKEINADSEWELSWQKVKLQCFDSTRQAMEFMYDPTKIPDIIAFLDAWNRAYCEAQNPPANPVILVKSVASRVENTPGEPENPSGFAMSFSA